MCSQLRCLIPTGFTRTAMPADRISSPTRDPCHERQTAALMPQSIAALRSSSAPAQSRHQYHRCPRLTSRPATAPTLGQSRKKVCRCQLLQAGHPTSQSPALRLASCRDQATWMQPLCGQSRWLRPLPPLSTRRVLTSQAEMLLQEVCLSRHRLTSSMLAPATLQVRTAVAPASGRASMQVRVSSRRSQLPAAYPSGSLLLLFDQPMLGCRHRRAAYHSRRPRRLRCRARELRGCRRRNSLAGSTRSLRSRRVTHPPNYRCQVLRCLQ